MSKPAPFTTKHLTHPRDVMLGTDHNGVQWVTDRYVIARADLFRVVPKAVPDLDHLLTTATLRRVTTTMRKEPRRPVSDTRGAIVQGGDLPPLRLLDTGGFRYLGFNDRVMSRWLTREWSRVTIADGSRMVVFWEGRRGRDVLAGAVMGCRITSGRHEPLPLVAAAVSS